MSQTVFVWTHGGRKVSIAGTFNGWNPEPLTKQGNYFFKILNLKDGVHFYKYVVDGTWQYDLGQLSEDDGSGNWNNYIEIGQKHEHHHHHEQHHHHHHEHKKEAQPHQQQQQPKKDQPQQQQQGKKGKQQQQQPADEEQQPQPQQQQQQQGGRKGKQQQQQGKSPRAPQEPGEQQQQQGGGGKRGKKQQQQQQGKSPRAPAHEPDPEPQAEEPQAEAAPEPEAESAPEAEGEAAPEGGDEEYVVNNFTKSDKPPATSFVEVEVVASDIDTDLTALEAFIRSVQHPGLSWEASKSSPHVFGLHKINIICKCTEDVSVEDVCKTLEENELVGGTEIKGFTC